MNRVYKVIWSKVRNCYVAVSELAKNHGKDSVRSEKRSLVKGMSALALGIALSLGVTGSVWAADPLGDTTVAGDLTVTTTSTDGDTTTGGNLTVAGKTTTGSLQNADGTIVLGADGSITAGSLNLGTTGTIKAGSLTIADMTVSGTTTMGTLTVNNLLNASKLSIGTGNTVSGNNSVAIGESNIVSGKDSIAAGSGSTATGNFSVAVGRKVTAGVSGKHYAAAFGDGTTASGQGSFAAGLNTTASNKGAAAFGDNTTASGIHSVAFGQLSQATGNRSAAFGANSIASGSASFASGNDTQASGEHSIAMGNGARASGSEAVAFMNSNASGGNAMAFGLSTRASGRGSTSFGNATLAGGDYSTAYGKSTWAAGTKSSATGSSTVAHAENSQSAGEFTQAIGKNSFAFGHYTTAGRRFQTEQDKADGVYYMMSTSGSPYAVKVEDKRYTWAVSDPTYQSTSPYDTKVAKYTDDDGNEFNVYYAHNNATNSQLTAVRLRTDDGGEGDNAEYTIRLVEWDSESSKWRLLSEEEQKEKETDWNGNRQTTYLTNVEGRFVTGSDMISVYNSAKQAAEQGNPQAQAFLEKMFPNGAPTDAAKEAVNAVAFGNDTNATSANSLAFGDDTLADNKRATAFGNHTEATGDSSTSFGDNTWASARNATSFGESTRAASRNATAFGSESAATGTAATAWGHKSKATGLYSSVWGDRSLAAGASATSFGDQTTAFAQGSTAWGANAVAGISTDDEDYQIYKGMVDDLVTKENDLKTARNSGNKGKYLEAQKALTKQQEAISNFYATHFVTEANVDQANALLQAQYNQAVKDYNQAIADYRQGMDQQVVDEINFTAFKEVYWIGFEEFLANQNITEEDFVAQRNQQYAESTGRTVDQLTEDEKYTVDNYRDKIARDVPKQAWKQILEYNGKTYMTTDDLTEDQKSTAIPDGLTEPTEPTPVSANENLGSYATAWGENTNAVGRSSTAWGDSSKAFGKVSTAFGTGSTAYGDNSLAGLGGTTGTKEINATGAIAIGQGAVAEKSHNIALGQKAQALGENAIVIGAVASVDDGQGGTTEQGSTVTGNNSIAIGSGHTVSGNNSGAFGDPDVVEGDNSYIIGNNSSISVNDAFVLGNEASVTADGGVAIGTGSKATRDAENESKGSASTIYGYDMSNGSAHTPVAADPENNIAGDVNGTWAPTAASVAVGAIDKDHPENNITRRITGVAAGSEDTDAVNVAQLMSATSGSAIHYYSVNDTGSVREAGNGTNYNNDGATGINSMAAGQNTLANGNNGVVVGHNSMTSGNNSTIIGQGSSAAGGVETRQYTRHHRDRSVYGPEVDEYTDRIPSGWSDRYEYSSDNNSILGQDTHIVGNHNIAIGTGSKVGGTHDTGSTSQWHSGSVYGNDWGYWYYDYERQNGATNSILIGDNSNLTGDYSTIVGSDSSIISFDTYYNRPENAERSSIVGYNSHITGNHSVIIGSDSTISNYSKYWHYDSGSSTYDYGDNPSYNSIIVGDSSNILGSNSIIFGTNSSIKGYDKEDNTEIGAHDSIAIGDGARIRGDQNIAIGVSSYVGDYYISNSSSQVWQEDQGSVSNSTAVGRSSTVYSDNGTAVGQGSMVVGANSSAFGQGVVIYGKENNTAIGAHSSTGIIWSKKWDQEAHSYVHDSFFGANNTAVGADSHTGSGYNNVAIGTGTMAGYWSNYSAEDRQAALENAVLDQYGGSEGAMAEAFNRAGKVIDAQIANNPPDGYAEWTDEQKNDYRNSEISRYLYNSSSGQQIFKDMEFEQWQAGKIMSDDYSTAVGVEAQAASAGQTAVGGRAKALGWHSTAVGLASKAEGASAIAIGESANTNDNQEIAVGNYAHTYGQSSIAMGRLAGGNTNYAIAIGDNATVQYRPEEQWVVAGYNTDGTAIVNEEDQTNHVQRLVADHSIAIGRDSYVDAKDATAVGRNTQARMRNATAYGNNAHANAWNSIAIGNKATAGLQADILNDDDDTVKGPDVANSAIAIGNRARATAEYTTAVGAGTNAEGWHAVAVGDSNQATGRFSTAIGAGWSINHTEGEDDKDNTTDDATGDGVNTEGLRTYESIGSNVAAGDYSTSVGYGNTTVSEHSLAVGAGNVIGDTDGDKDASGIVIGGDEKSTGSIAFGNWNTVTGKQSIAVGTGLTVTGNNSGAFGDPGKLDGNSSYMIGNDNEIADGSDYSFVVGNNVKTTLPKTVVIGHHTDNTKVFGENSTSLGFDAVAQEDDSVALGSKSVASRDITKEGAGYDVLTGRPYDGKDREGKEYKNAVNPKSHIWTPTRGEVAVGDVENNITRRITGVAAGAEDTDAVNVAQLKIATTGFQTHYYSVEIDDPDDPDGLGSNYDNLGATKPGSVAAGYYTSATGFNSTAVGNMTRAEDSNSVAVGHQAHAHSEDSTAVGVDADAYGKGAIAFGHQATSGVLVRITPNMKEGEEGYDPTKVKYEATIIQQTKDNDSYVFRARKEKDENNQPKVAAYNVRTQDYYEAKLNDNGNYDIGNKIEVEESDLDMGGIAMGSFAHSEGDRSLAVGRASGAYGEDSAAIGINSNALGDGGLAIGHGSSVGVQAEVKPSSEKEGKDRANGFWTTEVERDATGNPKANGAIGGIAIGSYAHTEGTRALAVGRVASAYGENSTAMGLRSSAYGEGSMAFGHGVVAGNENEKYAAQVPDLHNNPSMDYDLDGKDGTHVQTSNVIGAVALGSYAEATGRGSLSVGRYSEAQSAYTVAMGIRAEAGEKSENAIAIGREAKVAAGSGDYGGSNSIAMGTLANVKGMNSIAIGTAEFTNKEGTDVLDREKRKGTSVTGNSSIAIGQSDTITGDNSIAIGTGHVIKGSNSGAFGDPNVVNADASYIVGNNSKIDGKDEKTVIDSSPVKDAFILGNDSNVSKSFGVALGSKTTVSAEGGVALGSESVASRGTSTGGFNVVTGAKDYTDGTSTWESTHAAVSVGTTDGKVTRQITGLAAGTEDTDAVNVAQLKLAVGGVTYTAGKNITIDGNVINATGSVYTANQTVEAGGPGEGRTTLNITDGDGGDAGSMTVKAGKNVTITEEKESGKSIAVINATDTTYTVTSEAGDAGTNVVNNYTMTGTNGDKYTFSDTDTTYTADQVVNAGTGWKNDEGGSTTFTITDSSGNNLKPMTIKAGDNVKITKGENGEAVIQGNGLKNDENAVVYDENGEGSVTITDQAGNTTKITNIRSLGGEGIADSINYLGDRINNLDKKINKVGAGAAALAGLHPLDFDPDEKWDFSAAAGSYKGEHAVAIGAFYRPNEDTMFSVGGTIGNGNNMVNVGVSWKFGQKNRISANRISSAKEIIELRKNQEDVHSFLADAVAGNQLDLSKIQLFPDVEENHWAYDYVATMAGNGVLEGYPDGYFKGNRNMTRYEMAAVLYRLMQNGARLSDRALTEFAPELDRIRVDTITKHKDGTPHIQRVRTIKERVDEKADPSSEKNAKKKAKVKVAEKPVE